MATTKLAPFIEQLTQALIVDGHRSKSDKRTGRALLGEIRAASYQGGYTRLTSIAQALEQERSYLIPSVFDGYVEKPARVSSTCLVAMACNRYSVPCKLAGQRLSTRLYPTRVGVFVQDQVLARHERLGGDRCHDSYRVAQATANGKKRIGALRGPRNPTHGTVMLPPQRPRPIASVGQCERHTDRGA